jgi:methyltransferase (TIGR00027 family)
VRASIAARARFVEDLVDRQANAGVGQYLILGAGCDTFAARRPDLLAKLILFEVDRPGPQAWKRQRLIASGLGVHDRQRLVPVDFEAGADWLRQVQAAGFDAARPAVVSAIGLAMYLGREANRALLRTVAGLAAGTILVMSFMVPGESDGAEERALRRAGEQRARAAGTPIVSLFAPEEIAGMARAAGFRQVRHVSADELGGRYFEGRSDGLWPLRTEDLIVATR